MAWTWVGDDEPTGLDMLDSDWLLVGYWLVGFYIKYARNIENSKNQQGKNYSLENSKNSIFL